jgi:NADPH-dependent 2,4-dienoyl-CoA reductase/sulfur reductase-like enzyme/peroxiredoxin family protein/rhodanese-related sulfurtransferase/TusA-related sulfurtransferase
MKYVIVGGVAGGATTAARIRRISEEAEIILIEKGKYISYANCGLPYYIGDVIQDRNKLFVQTPASFGGRFNVDVRVENEVMSIDKDKKEIVVRRNDGSKYKESYDKLLLSPGAYPIVPNMKGVENEGVFVLRNVTDTDRIKNYISTNNIKRAVVVGAGFIGLEMAENLAEIGAEVTIVEKANQVMAPIDFSMAAHVHQHLLAKGVNLELEQSVEKIEKKGYTINAILDNGKTIETDIIILSIGVRPENTLALDAGLKIGETSGIWVNDYLQTSDENIYAVGDAIEFPHPITKKPWLNYLANPANRQGRIVADNMVFGNKIKYEGAIGTSIAKVFDLTVASTGLAAKKLKQLGIEYLSSTTHSNSHAGYYPDSLPLTIKLVFEPKTGRIFGAQGVGFDGVDKRIDQIALLIKKGGTIYDLMELEHAYAPPYSSAKDPIAIAGYVASNILNGTMQVASWREVKEADRSQVLILDVRTPMEFAMGSVPGALNIPVDSLREGLSRLPKDKRIYLYCAIGLRGYLAYRILSQHGFNDIRNLSGGYKTFSTSMAPIINQKKKLIDNEHEDAEDTKFEAKQMKTIRIDACGLQCPGPIIRLKEAIDGLEDGQRVQILSTDAGFARDSQAWCDTTGNLLISSTMNKGVYEVVVEKNPKTCEIITTCQDKGKTFIVFSDDLDKALASMVLANGAAATGDKVTIFFTFWGLNVIKKINKPKVEKDIFGKMFSMMLPSSSLKLKLSKMSMLGIGDRMMRYIMKKKNIESLESLRDQALKQGVEFIACQMSMDVMGVKREELLDEVTIGGVATYMDRASRANVNLFI